MAEKKPIIALYLWKPKEAWFRLSEEEQKELTDETLKSIEEVGGKRIVNCYCRWSNPEWDMFAVFEYPNIEAVQNLAKPQGELEVFRYVEMKAYLGTPAE